MLKFNPDTKIIFDNDDAAVAPIREITRDEVADLIANGASVDASANVGEQTSSPAATDGAAPAAQDPVAPATGSDTEGEQGNVSSDPATVASVSDTSATVSGSVSTGSGTSSTTSTDASGFNLSSSAPSESGNAPAAVDVSPTATAAETPVPADSVPLASTESVAAADVSPNVGESSTLPAASTAEPTVVNDALADPGGAGAADLNPKPAAPNLDAQPAITAASDAVPLAVGGAADPGADGQEEHPLTIIAEIEALFALLAMPAVHEYHRILRRLADLKNHPQVKDGAE